MTTKTKETYMELSNRHQNDINNFPLGFAFNDEQFKLMCKALNAKTKDDLVSIGNGGFLHKDDLNTFKNMIKRHEKEFNEALNNKDFAIEAFVYELKNHEYGYTGDPNPAIQALGLTHKQIKENSTLRNAFRYAVTKCQ